MKKTLALLLIVSVFFVGNIYGDSMHSASQEVTDDHEAHNTVVDACSATTPTDVTNANTFVVKCELASNSHLNTVAIKSTNGGVLLNETDDQLSPRAYTGTYTINVTGDTLVNTTSDDQASGAVTTAYANMFDVDTKLDGGDQIKSITATIIGTFEISANGDTGTDLDTIYMGTYSDTIYMRFTQGQLEAPSS